jgi:hypothetical protein
MADEEPTYSVDVKIQRGNGTDDRDTLKATVQANTLHELDKRKAQMLDRLDELAQTVRAIQPDETVDRLTDDQTTLDDQEAES